MPSVSFVYPNLARFHNNLDHIRGGLNERWIEAKKQECDYIEVPGTLIKNKSEEKITGLSIGDFLTEKEISEIYLRENDLPDEIRYILHTEPSLSKQNLEGRKIQPAIKWYDEEWTKKYLDMVIQIMEYLGKPADIIEIHPGYKKNTFEDICKVAQKIINLYDTSYGFNPIVLLENRTQQFISRGKDIKQLWEHLKTNYPHLEQNFGIVLDVQQLKSKTRDNFIKEFDLIPLESLKGFHIHTKHRWPKHNDPIPWKHVFGKIRQIEHNIIINPEIHQYKRVNQSIEFCKELIGT